MIKRRTHEQFLEDLWNKNKYYREGMFEVIGQYVETHTKILVKNKYGVCAMQPNSLLNQGANPHIISAINKTEYFINECIEKFGDNNDDLSCVEYVSNRTKIKVISKFGEYMITPHSYLSGQRSKAAYCTKSRLNKDVIFSRIKNLHPDLEVLPFDYNSQNDRIFVKNKYGVCNVVIACLFKGRSPTIESAINKNEYFINQAREVHGDKYDYSLVEYKHSRIKVKIISKNNIFLQTPSAHLSGNGCPTEAIDRMGWTSDIWKMSAEHSNNFTGYKVYFLECWDENEMFYKIGRTYRNLDKRFSNKLLMPYYYKVLHTVEHEDPKYICELEIKLKQQHKMFKYKPYKKFNGSYECFSKLNITECF